MCIFKQTSCNVIKHDGILNYQLIVKQGAFSAAQCDQACEVQVMVLEDLITKECPFANTELQYYYK